MKAVTCGFKAFDVHELLCHLVAKDLGYYASEGLDVRLADVALTPDAELPPVDYFQVACGSAFASRRAGYPFRVVLAGVDRPMFWLVGAPAVRSIQELAGGVVVTYPPIAPPYSLLRAALRKNGMDPDVDVELRAARDDEIRLGFLGESDVRASLVSSAIGPSAIESLGLRTLLFLGDELRFVSSGIAVSEQAVADAPEMVHGLIRAHRRSLDAIHGSPEKVVPVFGRALRESLVEAERSLRRVRECYTPTGGPRIDELDESLEAIDREMAAGQTVQAAELYDFSFLED